MGRADFLSVVLRLVGVELYKIRRRAMSKVMTIIGILLMILGFAVVSLLAIFTASAPVNSFLLPPCSAVQNPKLEPCLNHSPTPADLVRAQQAKQQAVEQASAPLRLPTAISTANTIAQGAGLLLIVILAGTIVGGEYSVGTLRLVFTRGPTRTQFLLSKIGAILACIVVGYLAGLLIGILSGALLNFFMGVGTSFSFLTAGWIGHLILYLLISILGLFMYSMIALCLSILGRATAAGVAGALVWWVLEGVLGQAFSLAGSQVNGVMGDILKAIPDYFISRNMSSLLQNQSKYLFGDGSGQLSDVHALLVLAAYLVLFIGLAWWTNESRDVTN